MMKRNQWITVPALLICMFFVAPILVVPNLVAAQELQTGNASLAARVAPGESLPLAVRLSNFGNNERVDVSIQYDIFDAQEQLILSQTETVAVETSASYLKQIPLPSALAPGLYTARTSIIYQGQKVPATASQQFTVERKFYGIFMSDLMTDIGIIGAVALLSLLAGLLFRRSRRASLFVPHDYSNIPNDIRIYYEILSDAIQQMRYHEGDRAVAIAAETPGLTLHSKTSKVLKITGNPSEVIASLVSQYQKTFGKKLNLVFGDKKAGHAIVR